MRSRRQIRLLADAPIIVLISTRDAEYGQRVANGLAAGYVPKDELSLAAILAIIRP